MCAPAGLLTTKRPCGESGDEGLAEGIYEKLVGYAELMDFCLKAMKRHTPCDPTNSKS